MWRAEYEIVMFHEQSGDEVWFSVRMEAQLVVKLAERGFDYTRRTCSQKLWNTPEKRCE
jgi:hypothetical protein